MYHKSTYISIDALKAERKEGIGFIEIAIKEKSNTVTLEDLMILSIDKKRYIT